jgi:UTP--glucose-1-phosphate uridylyltransferase
MSIPRQKVTKAVIPVAGFGTRFLPQTKAMPKEMLPLVDKPIIQYIVENLVDAGIKDIILVTGFHKRAIEDHFDKPSQDLVENLKTGGEKKKPLLDLMEEISTMANFVYLRQKGPYGNGTPLQNVAHIVDDEPFIYAWGDDFIDASPNEFQQLISAYEKYGHSCLACVRADRDSDYKSYGFISGKTLEPGVMQVEQLIEKPGIEHAPSNLATVSSFLFTQDVFSYVDQAMRELSDANELYWADVVNLMMKDKLPVLGVEIKNGKFLDLGNKFEYMKASIEFGLRDKEIGDDLRDWIMSFCNIK